MRCVPRDVRIDVLDMLHVVRRGVRGDLRGKLRGGNGGKGRKRRDVVPLAPVVVAVDIREAGVAVEQIGELKKLVRRTID